MTTAGSAGAVSLRTKALLVGLNYAGTPQALSGCINDVTNVSAYLRDAAPGIAITTITDAGGVAVTRSTVLAALTVLAAASATTDFVWIHFSGHGTWVRDTSGDETDRRDETIVLHDGVLTDDQFSAVLATFAATCTVFVVFDSCHSGTMGDMKFAWPHLSGVSAVMSQPRSRVKARVACLSGCADTGTSAEIAGAGALTTALLRVLGPPAPGALQTKNLFEVAAATRAALRAARLAQVPLLTSSFNLTRAVTIAPVVPPAREDQEAFVTPVIPAPAPAPAPAAARPPPRRRPMFGYMSRF
jgi:hypothetical protein